MVDEKERKLLRLVLKKTLGSESGKRYVIERLGTEYVEIGEALLRQMKEEDDVGRKQWHALPPAGPGTNLPWKHPAGNSMTSTNIGTGYDLIS